MSLHLLSLALHLLPEWPIKHPSREKSSLWYFLCSKPVLITYHRYPSQMLTIFTLSTPLADCTLRDSFQQQKANHTPWNLGTFHYLFNSYFASSQIQSISLWGPNLSHSAADDPLYWPEALLVYNKGEWGSTALHSRTLCQKDLTANTSPRSCASLSLKSPRVLCKVTSTGTESIINIHIQRRW